MLLLLKFTSLSIQLMGRAQTALSAYRCTNSSSHLPTDSTAEGKHLNARLTVHPRLHHKQDLQPGRFDSLRSVSSPCLPRRVLSVVCECGLHRAITASLCIAGGITGDRPLFPGVFTQNVPAFDGDSNRHAQDSYIQLETADGKKEAAKPPVIASDCQRHLHPRGTLVFVDTKHVSLVGLNAWLLRSELCLKSEVAASFSSST